MHRDGRHHQVEVEDWAERVCGRYPDLLYGHDADTRLACLFRVSARSCELAAAPRRPEKGLSPVATHPARAISFPIRVAMCSRKEIGEC